MTKNEKMVFILLILIVSINVLLIFILHHDYLLILINLEFLQYKKTITIYSLLGLHSIFALLTMYLSNKGTAYKYRYISIWLAIVAPIFLFIYYFKIIVSYQTESYFFWYTGLFFFIKMMESKKISKSMRKYIRTLVNPLGNTPY